MIHKILSISFLVLIQASILVGQYISNNDFTVFESEKYSFSAWYPNDWEITKASFTETELKVKSRDGLSDFSIIVQYHSNLKNTTTEEFVKLVLENNPEKVVKESYGSTFEDVVVYEVKHSKLSSLPAIQSTVSYTVTYLDIEIPMKSLVILTLSKGYIYTLTFRTEPELFDEMMLVFTLICHGFILKPS